MREAWQCQEMATHVGGSIYAYPGDRLRKHLGRPSAAGPPPDDPTAQFSDGLPHCLPPPAALTTSACRGLSSSCRVNAAAKKAHQPAVDCTQSSVLCAELGISKHHKRAIKDDVRLGYTNPGETETDIPDHRDHYKYPYNTTGNCREFHPHIFKRRRRNLLASSVCS
ncbi:hypothetical protein Bbelb_325570 [Branchiostoma belcheri]|nr:hypothetical protein Bbelb_325570 [Branchiostoma belcheri]